MPYSSSVFDESGNIFKIKGPYNLNYNETRVFGYINKFTIWREQINIIANIRIGQILRRTEIIQLN
jgi:hypothetical protein